MHQKNLQDPHVVDMADDSTLKHSFVRQDFDWDDYDDEEHFSKLELSVEHNHHPIGVGNEIIRRSYLAIYDFSCLGCGQTYDYYQFIRLLREAPHHPPEDGDEDDDE